MKHFLSSIFIALISTSAMAHYPILECNYSKDANKPVEQVNCEASFSDRSKAPNIVMEVFSEDDEVISKGFTNARSNYQFDRPEGEFFIVMDAGPGHILEISSEEVIEQ